MSANLDPSMNVFAFIIVQFHVTYLEWMSH